MSALAVLLVAAVAALLPIAVVRPWIGFLGYTWLSLMVPHRLVGGTIADWPLVKMVAVATLLGLVFTRDRAPLPRGGTLGLLLAFWLATAASTLLTAADPDRAWVEFVRFSKVVFMTFVALVLFRDREKIQWWLLVIGAAIGSIAVSGAIGAVINGFSKRLYGPPGSMIGDNNNLGFVFTIVLPVLAYLAVDGDRRWVRRLGIALFTSTLIAIVATYSRGAFIGACVVVALLLVLQPRRALIGAVAVTAVTVLARTSMDWFTRMATITPAAHQVTESGAQRMKSWYVAWRLGLDHPLLGAGFRPCSPDVYARYIPGYSDYHDAHNHFLQVLAEHGTVGALLFVALLVSVAVTAWHTFTDHQGPVWTRSVARMSLVCLVAYGVGGMFINAPYLELLYQLIAVALLAGEIGRSPQAALDTGTVRPLSAMLADAVRRDRASPTCARSS